MGTGVSKKAQVTPVVAQISVLPRSSVLEQSSCSQDSGGGNHGSEDTLKKDTSRSSSSRPSSNLSTTRKTSAVQRVGGAAGGGTSRPISTVSGRLQSGKGYPMRSGGMERIWSPSTALPLIHRDMENADLSTSQRSQRLRTVGHLFQEVSAPENDVIFLRMDPSHTPEHPASCCQLCGNRFTNLGIRSPLLLLCGHSYCSSCLEKACESYDYPVALKCGICLIVTPLEQLSPKSLPQNEALLDLVGSKEFAALSSEAILEPCAECVHRTARVYCSECVASFCEVCSKKAHEGSRVRAKHRPVSITLKPHPQPTCKKHPGQSCVMYCETEKQPMCVLCKFYNQHKFHKFELMSKVASKYNISLQEKLKQLDHLEKELDGCAQALYKSVSEINSSATRVQERLEKHFTEMKKSYLAALERREATLLNLVDRQVDKKQEILAEMRLEVAAARAKVLAAREEGSKLANLNPVTALLSRRHMDLSADRALRQTITSHDFGVQPDVPLSLLPDITSNLVQTLSQHGAILQLPPKPYFTDIQVATKTISLEWEVLEQNTGVSSDRTMTFSLHCYGDIPYKLERKLTFKKKLRRLITPESGFEDMSEMGSESRSTFPSLPPSSLGSRNISLVPHQEYGMSMGAGDPDGVENSSNQIIREESEDQDNVGKSNGNRILLPLLPEPIRLPKRRDEAKLPQLMGLHSANASLNAPNLAQLSKDAGSVGSGILNLPPLIVNKPAEPVQLVSMQSMVTSGVFEEEGNSPHMSAVEESEHSDQRKSSRPGSSSSMMSELSDEVKVNEYTELGRFCQGYAFDEIYCGEESEMPQCSWLGAVERHCQVHDHIQLVELARGWGDHTQLQGTQLGRL